MRLLNVIISMCFYFNEIVLLFFFLPLPFACSLRNPFSIWKGMQSVARFVIVSYLWFYVLLLCGLSDDIIWAELKELFAMFFSIHSLYATYWKPWRWKLNDFCFINLIDRYWMKPSSILWQENFIRKNHFNVHKRHC